MTDDVDIRAATLLDDAAELISDPDRWTRGAPARDAGGAPISPRGVKAEQWCVGGALAAVSRRSKRGIHAHVGACWALDKAAKERGWRNHHHANDGSTHGEALAMVDRARKQLRKEGSP
jgi:hypothetical protein